MKLWWHSLVFDSDHRAATWRSSSPVFNLTRPLTLFLDFPQKCEFLWWRESQTELPIALSPLVVFLLNNFCWQQSSGRTSQRKHLCFEDAVDGTSVWVVLLKCGRTHTRPFRLQHVFKRKIQISPPLTNGTELFCVFQSKYECECEGTL